MDFSERDVKGRSQAKRTRCVLAVAGALLLVSIIVLVLVVCLELFIFNKDCTKAASEQGMISKTSFGKTKDGKEVFKITLKNERGVEVDFITFGGILNAIRVPDKNGKVDDVILGLDTLAEYEAGHPYFGALVGRYANRIAKGQFELDGVNYQLPINNGPNSLHGGEIGWSMLVWDHQILEDSVVLSLTSPDGDQGYPGEVKVNVTYRLTSDSELELHFRAETHGKATPINLTFHPYFNLGGEGTGNIYDHKVYIYADKYTPVDAVQIPTGIANVSGTMFDFRSGVSLREAQENKTDADYDHNFCIRGPTGRKLAARVEHADSGRVMEVYTNQPGLQFYTGNFLNVDSGKAGKPYMKHDAFCMEPQNYPDAPNHADFPDSILRPGSTYIHNMGYKFL